MKRRQPVNLKYRTKCRNKRKKNTQQPKPKSIFSIKSTYKTTLQLLCVRIFFSLSHFHFTHNDVKWAEFVVTACNRTLLHGLHVCMCIELSLNLNLKSNCQYKIRCQSHFYLFFGDEIWWASKAWKTFFSHTLFSLSILIHIEVFFCVCVCDALSHKSERLLMNDGKIYATYTSTMWNNQSWIFTCHWHKMKCYLHNVQLRLWQIE